MKLSSGRQEANTGFWLCFLAGVVIELFFLIPVLAFLFSWLQPSASIIPTQPTAFPTYELVFPFLVGYFLVPIPYYIFASCRQKPKKIIPTTEIGLWTGVLAGIIVEMMLPSSRAMAFSPALTWLTVLLIFAVAWMLSLLLLVTIGRAQALIIRWLVGLNENPPYHVTYRVKVAVAKVRDTALNEAFLGPWTFKVVPHEPELVLRSHISWMPRIDNLIIIGASGDNETLIHGTAYAEDLYDICKNKLATIRLGRIINDLVGDLNVVKGEPVTDEHLKTVATGFVSQHTRTKFSMIQDRFRGWLAALGRIERPYRTALGWILAVWVLIDALIALLHLYGWEFDATLALIETSIFFPLAVIVDLLLPARISGKSGTV